MIRLISWKVFKIGRQNLIQNLTFSSTHSQIFSPKGEFKGGQKFQKESILTNYPESKFDGVEFRGANCIFHETHSKLVYLLIYSGDMVNIDSFSMFLPLPRSIPY